MATSEPNWQAVLQLLYDREITPGPGGFPFDFQRLSEVIADELDVPEQQARSILHDMEDFGLLTTRNYERTEPLDDPDLLFGLSERGFDVELRQRQTQSQIETNTFLGVFTAALVMISLTEAIASAPIASPATDTIIRIVGALIVAAMLLVAWYMS